jgi:hypothetical protein
LAWNFDSGERESRSGMLRGHNHHDLPEHPS